MPILHRKRWAILTGTVLLLAFVLVYEFNPDFKKQVDFWFSSISNSSYSLGQNLFGRSKENLDQVVLERDQLRSQVNSLTQQLALQAQQIKENDDLKSLLEIKLDERFKKTVAYVVGKDPDLNNALVVNQGRDSGVKAGDLVLSGDGVVAGTVLVADAGHSTILLLTDPQVKIAVSKLGAGKSIGLTKGQFGLSVIVEMIPQTEEINESDVFVTSDINPQIPGNLVIGTVKRVTSEPNQLFKEAIVSPATDFSTLKMVSILTQL